MQVQEIPVSEVDVSEFNARKNLEDGEADSTIDDLANSIERQGLLSPITVFQRPDGRYPLVAGQRRLLAMRQLKRATISAIVRDNMSQADATAVSLVENVHRADMNPRDKAIAFKTLLDKYDGNYQTVYKETGVGVSTIKKYVQLLNLAPELQEKLAAGETKSTAALATLSKQFADPEKQVEVYGRIGGFTEDVQQHIIKNVSPDLGNLGDLVDKAAEGEFNYKIVRNCPEDCSNIPERLKPEVARLIRQYKAANN